MRTSSVVVAVGMAALGVALGGCTRHFTGQAIQPNPLAQPTETLRVSEPIQIVRGDMDLEAPDQATGMAAVIPVHNHHFPLFNVASFTMVSRDRLRFHVQVDHKWEEYADLTTWDVHLEDDAGHRWSPETIEHARTKLLTTMWDREQRTAICDAHGRDGSGNCLSTIGARDDGWRRRQTLGNLSVFRGKADFVFYQRDLMTSQVRQLRLVVKRSGESFEFTWRFQDAVASN